MQSQTRKVLTQRNREQRKEEGHGMVFRRMTETNGKCMVVFKMMRVHKLGTEGCVMWQRGPCISAVKAIYCRLKGACPVY